MAKKSRALQLIMFGFTIWVFYLGFVNFAQSFHPITIPSYTTKKQTVEHIYADAKGAHFNRFAYDQSIYTFDYNYLFSVEGPKHGYTPAINEMTDPSQPVFLIVPPNTKQAFIDDFINYRTPNKEYKTTNKWVSPDGTMVLRRVKSK
jgi:hypothetical protein